MAEHLNPEQLSLSLSATKESFHSHISRLFSSPNRNPNRRQEVLKLKGLYDQAMKETMPTLQVMEFMDRVVQMRNTVDAEDTEFSGRRTIKVLLGHKREMMMIGAIIEVLMTSW